MKGNPEAVPQNSSEKRPPGIPDVIHWCAKHCTTLVWQDGHYANSDPPFSSEYSLESFTNESFVMLRTDYKTKGGETVLQGRAVLSGRISQQGNTVANGKITWTYHPCCGPGTGTSPFIAAWGAALNTVPGSDEERDRWQAAHRNQPGISPVWVVVVAAAAAGLLIAGSLSGKSDKPEDPCDANCQELRKTEIRNALIIQCHNRNERACVALREPPPKPEPPQ